MRCLAPPTLTAAEQKWKVSPMAWYVYMVRCRDDSLYCGVAKDVLRRSDEHNNSTRGS